MGIHIKQTREYIMSAGSLIGTLANIFFFGIFWMILGVAIDKIGFAFNKSIAILPTFQDAVTGFTMVQQVYLIMPAIVFDRTYC